MAPLLEQEMAARRLQVRRRRHNSSHNRHFITSKCFLKREVEGSASWRWSTLCEEIPSTHIFDYILCLRDSLPFISRTLAHLGSSLSRSLIHPLTYESISASSFANVFESEGVYQNLLLNLISFSCCFLILPIILHQFACCGHDFSRNFIGTEPSFWSCHRNWEYWIWALIGRNTRPEKQIFRILFKISVFSLHKNVFRFSFEQT